MIKLWSVAFCLTLLGCSQKSFEKSTQSEVVDALNAGDSKAVIKRIDPATASDDEKFYLASAHAMEAPLQRAHMHIAQFEAALLLNASCHTLVHINVVLGAGLEPARPLRDTRF